MHQIPEPIWLEIAEEANLKYPESKVILGTGDLGAAALEAALQEVEGLDNQVLCALVEILPIWLENRAIRGWMRREPSRAGLGSVFLELNSLNEVLHVMIGPYWEGSQEQQLEEFLSPEKAIAIWRQTAEIVKAGIQPC